MRFSETEYAMGLQCPKALWVQEHEPDKEDEPSPYVWRERELAELRDVAKGYFGAYVEPESDSGDLDELAERTVRLIEAGEPVICGAVFARGDCVCTVDILRVEADGVRVVKVEPWLSFDGYYLPARGMKRTRWRNGDGKFVRAEQSEIESQFGDHRFDMASYQLWLIERCGFAVKSVEVLHIDGDYVREGEVDPRGLFRLQDIYREARDCAAVVEENLEGLRAAIGAACEPEVKFGAKCHFPLVCRFSGWCRRNLAQPSVLRLLDQGTEEAGDLIERGIATFADARVAGIELTARQKAQIACELDGVEEVIDRGAVREALAGLSYPICYLDGMRLMWDVPPFDGCRPKQLVPVQYSLCIIDELGGELRLSGFLADGISDPRRALAEQLCEDVPAGICVVGYGSWPMIAPRALNELAGRFPDLADRLREIAGAMCDLRAVFMSGAYYHRDLWAPDLRSALMALVPEWPEVGEAGIVSHPTVGQTFDLFAALPGLPPEEREAIRSLLAAQGKSRALAIAKIHERLQEKATEGFPA